MGAHLIDGKFQSDKYPTCPAGKVPLSTSDPSAQDLLWSYAQRRRAIDSEFSDDLEKALLLDGFTPPDSRRNAYPLKASKRQVIQILRWRNISPPKTVPAKWAFVWEDTIAAPTEDAFEHLKRLQASLGKEKVRIKP